jgi:predicted RNase H-like nuclease
MSQKRLTPPTLAVDGCPGGWVGFAVGGTAPAPVLLAGPTLAQLVEEATRTCQSPLDTLAIDMPLVGERDGASSEAYARFARGMLPGCGARVFSPPSPDALACDVFPQANAANRRGTGKGLSKQAWNLVPKVREARALRSRLPESTCMIEVHPEVCFAQLAGKPIAMSKKMQEGARARVGVLCEACPVWARVLRRACEGATSLRQGSWGGARPQAHDIIDPARCHVSLAWGACDSPEAHVGRAVA